ncbi:heavy metal transport/detoxification protein [Parabacteroides sp. 52]|uniref:heavy metal transport/detoxification protein n=1 Tax=unclassified Parabacteroides TaxID=2649774 RepID=UPI0013D0E8E3|nr:MULTISPECIES: heavy metal transport/detoxification protein [unclassified Parabacteroides]MDH6534455.1 copper chaperone [Parabacteroides sp. PM5-20]NDV55096.1 heavy metal transport/detoxification protein [Parabacteroides sp. 52]
MDTMVFKTNAKCSGCESAMRIKLSQVIKENEWSLDLDAADKLLHVTADVAPAVIIEALADAGFRAEQVQ